jgi:hypothetical protein
MSMSPLPRGEESVRQRLAVAPRLSWGEGWRSRRGRLLPLLLLIAAAPAAVAELPEYLTLAQALASVDENHPGVQLAAQQPPQQQLLQCQQFELQPNSPRLLPGSCGYWQFIAPLHQQQLLVMRRFLDVVLADQRAARDSEAMATAYIRQDREKNRQQLGQRSEVDVAALDSVYQEKRRQFLVSESMQRVSRSLLAIAMNRPGQLPREVAPPEEGLFAGSKPLDEGSLLQGIEQHNPLLQRLQEVDDSALQSLARQYLRHVALEQLLSITLLRAQQRENSTVLGYRDLSLDKSRTLYELEVKADLGDAMVDQTAARLVQMETDYQLLMCNAVLAALRGEQLELNDVAE